MSEDGSSHGRAPEGLSRRDFLEGAATAALALSVLGSAAHAAPVKQKDDDDAEVLSPPAKLGVIGCGVWGRELLRTLAKLEDEHKDAPSTRTAQVTAYCDTSKAALRQAKLLVPDESLQLTDYKELLDNKDIQGVVIATPSHLHKQIVLDALAAGKHVYCEAPLATTIEDLKAICGAAKAAAPKLVCQPALQRHTEPMSDRIWKAFAAKEVGSLVSVEAQTHQREKLYRPGSAERNWRLHKDVSLGLVGEWGIHQIEMVAWLLKKAGRDYPVAVTGSGRLVDDPGANEDPNELYDSALVEFEYADGLRFELSLSAAASYGGVYEKFFGNEGTMFLKTDRGWHFRETGAKNLGWQPYARQDQIFDEKGYTLVANATSLLARGIEPSKAPPDAKGSVYYCLETFADAARGKKDRWLVKQKQPVSIADGYLGTVLAIKAHEAVVSGKRVAISADDLKIS